MTSTSSLGSTSIIAAVRPEPQRRRRRPRRPGRDQRGPRAAAGEPAVQPELSQGQSRGRADPAARADLRRRAEERGSTTSPPRSCSRRSRRSRASARSSSAAARCRPCASRSTRRRSNNVGLSLEDVRGFLASANVNRPKGQIGAGERAWAIGATDQLRTAAEYRAPGPLLPQRRRRCASRTSPTWSTPSRTCGRRASPTESRPCCSSSSASPAPTSSRRSTGSRPSCRSSRRRSRRPSGSRACIDRSTTIRASVRDVQVTLLISIVLVILVVFVFLRSVRATLIPSVAVPVSLVGTFGAMYLLGYSIDNLSLMALTIATGFVVDDAIVVIENITRHLENGASPARGRAPGRARDRLHRRSRSASRSSPSSFRSSSWAASSGRLFREFAVTLSVAILISMVDLADDDADDVRVPAPRARRARRRAGSPGERAGLRRASSASTAAPCRRSCGTSR